MSNLQMMNLKLKQVRRETYVPRHGCVYVMSHPSYLKDLRELIIRTIEGDPSVYIGVSENEIRKRWKDHKARRARDNQNTTHFIHENGYEFEDCVRIIFEGSIDQCLRLEYHLRKEPNMGLNKKVGGQLKEHRVFNEHYHNMICRAIHS